MGRLLSFHGFGFVLFYYLATPPSSYAISPTTPYFPSSFVHHADGINKGDGEVAHPSKTIKRRSRPLRRSAPTTSSINFKSRAKSGLSHTCPPLPGPLGAPPLPVLTTKDPRTIERWLEENVHSDPNEYTMVGFDLESIAKPPWKPERAALPDGPATIQLSTPSSCLIVQLSRCGDGSAVYAPTIIRSIINNPKIIKVGVGVDDDALELYRWSKNCLENVPSNHRIDQQQSPRIWEMTSRFDIGCVLPNKNPSRRSGIKELAQTILGVEIIKSKVCSIPTHLSLYSTLSSCSNLMPCCSCVAKKLTMSNWGHHHLTPEQIAYAARDAWVSAAIVERLQKSNVEMFRAESLMEMEFMKKQRSVADMDTRAVQRKKAKLELKAILDGSVTGTGDEDVEERKRLLNTLLDFYRPDQPPTLSEEIPTLTFF